MGHREAASGRAPDFGCVEGKNGAVEGGIDRDDEGLGRDRRKERVKGLWWAGRINSLQQLHEVRLRGLLAAGWLR
jgi:hypothetical protein